MPEPLVAGIASLVAMAVIDGLWLGVVARRFYRSQIGPLLAERTDWIAAVAFYLLYVLGVTVFGVLPGVEAGSPLEAVWRGGLFGLVAYATYDLTNRATLRGWPWLLVVVDIAWGIVLSAAVAGVAAAATLALT